MEMSFERAIEILLYLYSAQYKQVNMFQNDLDVLQ